MKQIYSQTRGIAIIVFTAFLVQIFAPNIPITYALNTAYYIDAVGGNDTNDGLSPATAWQTISKVNSTALSEGDSVNFNCGDSWNETLDLQYSGTGGNPITYGAYGTCDGTNAPIIAGTGGLAILETSSVSYVTLTDITASGGSVGFIAPATAATGIVLQNITYSNYGGTCLVQDDEKNIEINAGIFLDCNTALNLGGSGAIHVSNSTFSGMTTAITSTSNSTGSSLSVNQSIFTNIPGNAIVFTSNTSITQSDFTNICTGGSDCAAVTNGLNEATSVTISENTISGVGTGVVYNGFQDAIRLTDTADGVSVTDNTISNAQVSLSLINAKNTTVTGNTFFNPRAQAIVVEENVADATIGNTISNNTILTYNADYPMIKIDDMVDASGSLVSLSSNAYINIYKGILPIIESFSLGGTAYSLDKDALTTLDTSALNFTYFGYKNYTNTGSYSGSNLISNGSFGSNITGWTGDNTTLTHDSTGLTLHASQGVSQTGTISSNSFSLVSGATYEVSGSVKNLTNTGGSRIKVYIRQDASPFTLYADRVMDVVSTSSGKTFLSYITANADVSDARLDFEVSNPSSDIELDTIVVRRVTGLTRNPRTNEARLISNTGSADADFSCPGGGGCPLQYRDLTDTAVTFPVNVPAFRSQIILWRDPNSSFTPTYIVHRPSGSLVPSSGSVPNNDPIDLTWTSTNASSVILDGATLTGAFSYSVAASGTITVNPPSDATTTYTLRLANEIGTTDYPADVVTSNTPPIAIPAFATGSEDSLSITGVVTATDSNSGGSLSYSLFDPPAISQGIVVLNGDGTFDFTPTANFCGPATFTFRAFDAFGLGSDGLNPGVATITVQCTNDDPVTVDDTMTSTGGVSNLLDVVANDTDIDSPYEPQTFTPIAFTNPAHGVLSITGNLFDYVPDSFYVGPDSFTYSMMDQSGGLSGTGTVTLTVYPGSNLPPLVAPDSFNVTEDSPLVGTLSGYDLNPGDILTFSAVTLPTNGVVSIVGSGFTYTPNPDYNGPDSFVFVADDTALTSSSATISITVDGSPDVPVATNDTIGVEMTANVTLDVMANDNDPDSPYIPQNLSISGYSLPSHGTLSVVGTGFLYTSDVYLGVDTFEYTIVDIDGNLSDTGTVTLNITSTNTAPIAYSGSFATNEDTVLVGTLSGYDADATPLTFILDSGVSSGTLSLGATGGFVYTPTLNYNGGDSFSFHVSDGVFSSSVETITLTINSLNDAPSAGHDTGTGTEDTILILTGLLLNDSDIDAGDTITLNSVVFQGTKGTAVLSGTTDIIYTPIADACGLDTFGYQAQDQSGALSGTGNVTVSLICTNDAPTATGSSYSMTGNVLTNSGNVLTGGLAGSDIDLDVLTYTLGSGTTNGVLVFNTGGTFSYTPTIGFTGSDSFTFSATDGFITTGTATVLITVNTNNYNTIPIAYSGSFVTNEDTVLVGTLSGFDLEASPLTFTLGSGTSNGTISLGATGGFVYTPTANYGGTDSFTFRVSDGTFSSAYETGSITITTINDVPTAVADVATGTEDAALSIPVLSNDTDVDGMVFSITGLTQPSTGGTIAIVGTGLVLTPTANYCSATSVSFTYQAVDNAGGVSSSATGTFTITCVADSPVAVDDTQSSTEDTPFTILVLSNDTDVDAGDTVSISNITQPSTGGTVAISGLGIQYTPTTNFCSAVPITFNYRARDVLGNLSNTGTVSLTINCVNDLPIVGNVSYTMTGNLFTGAVNMLNTSLSGTDIETSSLTFAISTPISTGSLTISSSGAMSYIPSSGFVGLATGGYVANDGTSNSAIGTISICIISPDPLVALPSCVGGGSSPETPVIVGNGGGGGGGGGSSGGGGSLVFNFTQVIGGDASPELVSQLVLGRGSGSKNSISKNNDTHEEDSDDFLDEIEEEDTSNETESDTDETSINTNMPYSTLMDIITTVIDYSRDFEISNGDNVRDIRESGQTILRKINTTDDMTPSEKADALRTAAEELSEYLNPEPLEKEYKALKYVIRILKARESIIRDTLDVLSEIL